MNFFTDKNNPRAIISLSASDQDILQNALEGIRNARTYLQEYIKTCSNEKIFLALCRHLDDISMSASTDILASVNIHTISAYQVTIR